MIYRLICLIAFASLLASACATNQIRVPPASSPSLLLSTAHNANCNKEIRPRTKHFGRTGRMSRSAEASVVGLIAGKAAVAFWDIVGSEGALDGRGDGV